MITESISCPLCDGPAVSETKSASQFVHVICTGECRNEFVIGATAMRVFAMPDGAARKARAAGVVRSSVPPGKIHVVAWSVSNKDAELSIESRDAWIGRRGASPVG
jgi:hypothetical protein